MKKVLYTASTCSHLRNFHLPYLRAFHEAGWTVHAACGGAEEALPYISKLVHLPFTKSMTSPANLACVGRLSRLMREEGYDLVSTHTSLAAFFTRLAVPRGAGRPRVVNTVHGYLFDDATSPAKRALLLGAEKLTAGVTDLVLTMNETDRALALRHRLAPQVVNTPGMGVDLARFPARTAARRCAARAALGLPADGFLFVYAAEFSPRKNQEFLLRVLPALPARAGLILPGAGERRGACMALAEELGLGGRIFFPGHVDTLPYLTAADCCISASRSEGLPFNIMEAMAVGLPVAATAVKGHVDLCTGPQAEGLFPYGDTDACVRVCTRLMEDSAAREAFSVHNREHILPYGLDAVYPALLTLYGLA